MCAVLGHECAGQNTARVQSSPPATSTLDTRQGSHVVCLQLGAQRVHFTIIGFVAVGNAFNYLLRNSF